MQLEILITMSNMAHSAHEVKRTRQIKAPHRNHGLLYNKGKRNRMISPIKIEQSRSNVITQNVATTI